MDNQQPTVELPDILDISPEAVLTAEASLDPQVKPPADARVDTDKKTSAEYKRWAMRLSIDKVQRSATESKLTVFFVQARVRPSGVPGDKNVGKYVFSRYFVNFRVLNGLEVNEGHTGMNNRSMKSIVSLIKSAGLAPDDMADTGLKAAFLVHLFPKDTEPHTSPLIGKTFIGNCVEQPNNSPKAKFPRDTSVELWLPEAQLEAVE